MPRFDMFCGTCGYEFEEVFSPEALKRCPCPKCGELAKQVWRSMPGVIFKGAGFPDKDRKDMEAHERDMRLVGQPLSPMEANELPDMFREHGKKQYGDEEYFLPPGHRKKRDQKTLKSRAKIQREMIEKGLKKQKRYRKDKNKISVSMGG
jgi:putative FmdB family regulatory protein